MNSFLLTSQQRDTKTDYKVGHNITTGMALITTTLGEFTWRSLGNIFLLVSGIVGPENVPYMMAFLFSRSTPSVTCYITPVDDEKELMRIHQLKNLVGSFLQHSVVCLVLDYTSETPLSDYFKNLAPGVNKGRDVIPAKDSFFLIAHLPSDVATLVMYYYTDAEKTIKQCISDFYHSMYGRSVDECYICNKDARIARMGSYIPDSKKYSMFCPLNRRSRSAWAHTWCVEQYTTTPIYDTLMGRIVCDMKCRCDDCLRGEYDDDDYV